MRKEKGRALRAKRSEIGGITEKVRGPGITEQEEGAGINAKTERTGRKVRILQVTGGMNIGGAETMLMHLYRKIDRSRIQFDFVSFTTNKCHYDDEIKALGGRIFYVAPPNVSNPVRFIADMKDIIERYGPYHAVHAHTLFNSGLALLAARLAGVRTRICHSHNTQGDHGHIFIRKIYFILMRLLIKLNATENVACTKAAGRFLFGEKSLMKGKVDILYNAVDLAPYKSVKIDEINDLKANLGIDEGTLVLGHVGKFGEQKNHAFLVKLAEFLVGRGLDFKLVLIGEGDLRERIEKEVMDKGLDGYVKFLGVQRNIHLYMRMFDIFVFPSLYEGLGIVLIEAQAAGTPCVISDTIPDECDMGLGLIKKVSLGDSLDSWYEAIISSLKRERIPPEATTKTISENGYDLRATVKTLYNIYGLQM